MCPYTIRMSHLCPPHVTRVLLYVIRMSLVCTHMSGMPLLCTRMLPVCHSYVLLCHPYVTHLYDEPKNAP